MFFSVAFLPSWPQGKEQSKCVSGKRRHDVGEVIAAQKGEEKSLLAQDDCGEGKGDKEMQRRDQRQTHQTHLLC